MKVVRLSLIIGVLVFIFTLFFQLPAGLVLPHVQPHVPVTLHNVKGSLWTGSAGYVSYNNVQLGHLYWEFKPLHLFTGRVAAYVELQGDDLNFFGDVAVDLGQKVYLEDSSMQVDAQWVEKFKSLPVKVDGSFMGVINYANWDLGNKQKLPLVDGVINWQEGQTLKPIEVPPGNYQAKLLPDNDMQYIELSSDKAPLDLSGHINLKADGSYKPDLHFKATESANNSLRNMLALLGQPDEDGLRHFRQPGHVQQFLH